MATAASRYQRPLWRWYAATLLMLIYTLSFLDRGVANTLIQPIKAEFRLSDTQAGLITGFLFGLANAAAGIFVGPLVDRMNRRNVLGASLLVWSVLTGVCGGAGSFATLLAARAAVGAAESGGVPASLSMLASIFPEGKRSTVTGVFFLSSPFGYLLASAGGGLIAAHFGWRAAFFAASGPGVLLTLLMMLTLPEPPRETARAEPGGAPLGPGLLSALAYVLRHAVLAPHYLAVVLLALVTGGRSAFMVAFFMREHGLPIARAGVLVGMIACVGGIVGALTGGIVSDRLARIRASLPQWWLALVAGAVGVSDLVLYLHPDLTAALVAAVVSAAVVSMWLGPAYGVVMSIAPEAMRGRALTLIQIGANIATALGALAVGMLSDLYGGPHSLRWAMATMACVFFLVGAFFALAATRNLGGPVGLDARPAAQAVGPPAVDAAVTASSAQPGE